MFWEQTQVQTFIPYYIITLLSPNLSQILVLSFLAEVLGLFSSEKELGISCVHEPGTPTVLPVTIL